jgi:hypothetical protein
VACVLNVADRNPPQFRELQRMAALHFTCGSIATRPEIGPSSAEIVPSPMHLAGIIDKWSGIVSAFV